MFKVSRARYRPATYGQRVASRKRRDRAEYKRARIEKTVMNTTPFYGTPRGTKISIVARAAYTETIRYVRPDNLTQTSIYPIGFTQIVLKPYDTDFFKSNRILQYDRFRVSKIEIEYTPTGTESVLAQSFPLEVNARDYPSQIPFLNIPLYFGYDPTANVSNIQEALSGMSRFVSGTGNNSYVNANGLSVASGAMLLSQMGYGQSTEPFHSTIIKPRAITLSSTNPVTQYSDSVVNVSTQYTANDTSADGKLLTTYGTFNVCIPRVLNGSEDDIYRDAPMRVLITVRYHLRLYGQN